MEERYEGLANPHAWHAVTEFGSEEALELARYHQATISDPND